MEIIANTLTWMLLVSACYQNGTSTMAHSDYISPITKKDHLQVMVNEYATAAKMLRNSSGHLIGLEGLAPQILDWLSQRYDFDYIVRDTNFTTLRDVLPALVSYTMNGECDVIIGAIALAIAIGRSRYLDIPQAWLHSKVAFLIPMPEVLQNNVDAIIKPFQLWVWIALTLAFVSIVITLLFFKRHLEKIKRISNASNVNTNTVGILTNSNIFMYVIGTLLNQGGYLSCKITSIRLAIGAWCLLTLVIVNVYNGVLISYVMAIRHAEPLINSMEDVATMSNIKLVVDRGQGPDFIFSMSDKGLYKAMGDKLRSYPNSRCNSTQECIDLVKSLPPQHVYFNTEMALKEAMKEDYSLSHKCKLIIAAEDASSRPGSFLLRKNSPHLEKFNRGILTLRDMGLISYWEKQSEAATKSCQKEKYQSRYGKTKTSLKSLSLTNLAGVFAVLVIGYIISFLSFLNEIFTFRWRNK